MRFTQGRRRPAPSVIIVSLIDVLLVVLIFLMVSTTFRQTPAVRLALPQSKQGEKRGASPDRLVVTIAKTEPHLFLGTRPVTFERLEQELARLAAANSNLSLAIQADEGAPWGQIVRVMDAAKTAKIRTVDAATRSPGAP
ncbi:MAG: biopolymer transporter ExbD [Verrucomicrobiales bacterium]|nr:biopolymer transporter ExbD [Verrucomicrobiales bacterium]